WIGDESAQERFHLAEQFGVFGVGLFAPEVSGEVLHQLTPLSTTEITSSNWSNWHLLAICRHSRARSRSRSLLRSMCCTAPRPGKPPRAPMPPSIVAASPRPYADAARSSASCTPPHWVCSRIALIGPPPRPPPGRGAEYPLSPGSPRLYRGLAGSARAVLH